MEEMTPLRLLSQHLAREQDELLTDSNLAGAREQWLEVASERMARIRPKRGRHVVAWASGFAAAAALVLGVVAWLGQRALTFTVDQAELEEPLGTWLSAPPDRPLPLDFSDGSQVELEPASRARVLSVEQSGAHVVLESGAAGIHVKPDESTHWRFSAGPFMVEVLGTQFDLNWNPDGDQFELRMHEGEVTLSGCVFGAGRRVMAPEIVRASCGERSFEISSSHDPKEQAIEVEEDDLLMDVAGEEPTEDEPNRTAERAATPSETAWKSLAAESNYQEAYALLDAAGFEAQCAKASAGDLNLIADVARFSNHSSKAVYALELLRQRFPRSARAKTAAFSLAKIYFDQQGAFGQAARWFQIYLNEQPGGSLAREALGRLMESLERTGNRAEAKRRAAEYLEQYPKGPHAPVARALLGQGLREPGAKGL